MRSAPLNAQLEKMAADADNLGRRALVRIVETALRQRERTLEVADGTAYEIDTDAAEAIVTSVWRRGIARSNVDALVAKHGRKSFDLDRSENS